MPTRAKVEIDGKEIHAFFWRLSVGIDSTAVKVSCFQHNGPGLSLPREDVVPIQKPIYDLRLTDHFGAAMEGRAELLRIESHEKVGEVPSVDYFFKQTRGE